MKEDDSPARRSREDWDELAGLGRLATCNPEQIVVACRETGLLDARLRGRLLDHLCRLARPYLMRRVNKNMPNGGTDAVEDVVSAMSMAIVDPAARDGVGYAAAFFTKLQQRLADRHRTWRVQHARVEPLQVDDETGEALDPADAAGLNPEETAMAQSLVAGLPENYRRAFLLHRAGFPITSKEESISGMLGVSPQTADKWVKRAIALLREQLGSQR